MTLAAAITFIETDLEVNLLPVVIGALQIIQKNPSALGAAAAEAYLIANAPVALLAAEQTALNGAINTLSARLQAVLAAAKSS